MFDISWSEFLLIGVVALIVIGPKELPGVMRTLGQWMRKMRSMASDFQNQFQEAMREAEMTDLKKQVDDIAGEVSQFDPLKSVREDVESIGHDVQHSLGAEPEQNAALPAAAEPAAAEASAAASVAAAEAAGPAAAAPPAPPQPAVEPAGHELETVGAPEETAAANSSIEQVVQPDRTERSG